MGQSKINLCGGVVKIHGYTNVDICGNPDITIDLEKELLPFDDNSVDVIACNSAINYFTRARACEIIKDVYRVLKPKGVTRFGVQDLKILVNQYLRRNLTAVEFYDYFYGFDNGIGKHCKYVYDYIELRTLFREGGFTQILQMEYLESIIPEVHQIDNRREQMFFLEAIK
jgi:predicted SAM-dependent methyltransferase